MASNIPEKQNDVEKKNDVECAKCLGNLRNPKLLPCRHILCESCINDLGNNADACEKNYKCPMCKSVSPKAQAKSLTVIQELLDFTQTENVEREQICENCKQSSFEWQCEECKYSFCFECRKIHDSLQFLKHHTWTKISGDEVVVLDKRENCDTHPKEKAGLFCTKSHTFACDSCVVGKNNRFLNIKSALEAVITTTKKNLQKLENATQIAEKYVAENQTTTEQITNAYANIEEQMENQYKDVLEKAKQFYEEMLAKAEEDHNKLRADLYKIKRDQLRVIEQDSCRLELQIRSEKSVLALCEKSLSVARGATLLKVMRSGLRSSLELHVQCKPVYNKYSNKPNVFFIASQLDFTQNSQSNLVGKLFTHSNLIPQPLKDLRTKSGTLINSIQAAREDRFDLINNQMWGTRGGTYRNQLSIYSINGENIDKIADYRIANAGGCYSACQVKHTRVAVAAEKGLYLLNTEGQLLQKIQDGDFCDVSVIGENMYALDKDGLVHVLQQQTEEGYVQFNKFRIDHSGYTDENSIQATSKHVYIGDVWKNRILQYSHAGELTAIFPGADSCATGPLSCPRICGADDAGSILIANTKNNRLLIMTPEGEFAQVHLDLLGRLRLKSAHVYNNRLYVHCSEANNYTDTLKIFSLD